MGKGGVSDNVKKMAVRALKERVARPIAANMLTTSGVDDDEAPTSVENAYPTVIRPGLKKDVPVYKQVYK